MSNLYTRDTYTSPLDLLDKIDAFIVGTLGWTRNMAPTLVPTKSGKRAHYTKVFTKNNESKTLYWNIYAAGASEAPGVTKPSVDTPSSAGYLGIWHYLSSGYDNGLAWDRQPGVGFNVGGSMVLSRTPLQLAPSPASSFGIYGNTYGDIYINIIDNGTYKNINVGVLSKRGVWNGGEFFGGYAWANSSSTSGTYTEIPTYTVGTDNSGYASSPVYVKATVDSVTDWITFSVTDTIPPTDSSILNRSTTLFGLGNIATDSSIVPYINASEAAKVWFPHLNRQNRNVDLDDYSGIIIPYDIEVAVWRTSKSKYAPLGLFPIIKLNTSAFFCGIPVGYEFDVGDQLYYLSKTVMIEENSTP